MIRFALGFLTGLAAVYVWAALQLSTPETETSSDGSYPWPLYI